MNDRSETIGELAKALALAQSRLRPAIKDVQNPHLGSKYADLASVWEACREALTAVGLAVIQRPSVAEDGRPYLETILAHGSGEWIAGRMLLEYSSTERGRSVMQAAGSALTYSRRYSLAAMVGVSVEDDDGQAAGPAREAAPARRDRERDASEQAEGRLFPAELYRRLGQWNDRWAKRCNEAGIGQSDEEAVLVNRFQLVNELITRAIAAGQLGEGAVLGPGGKRDREQARRALEDLCLKQPAWVLTNFRAYLKEKYQEAAEAAGLVETEVKTAAN